MTRPLSSSAQKVQDMLRDLGFPGQVVEMPQTTRSAAEAADAIGCKIEQIAKSLIFKTRQTGKPVLVIASGINRVKEKRIEAVLGEKLEKADADSVRERPALQWAACRPLVTPPHSTSLSTKTYSNTKKSGPRQARPLPCFA